MRSRSSSGSIASFLRQLVDSLFQCECTGCIARTAHGAAWPSIDEDVVLFALEIRTFVHRLRDIADASSSSGSCRPICVERDGGEQTVLTRADLQALECRRAVAGVELFLVPIEHKPDWRVGGTGKSDGGPRIIARAGFRSKSAAHRIDDDPDLIARQLEGFGEFIAYAGGKLCREVDRQSFRPPIGDDGMGFRAAMRLHLRAKFPFDHDVGFGKAFGNIAARTDFGRPADVSLLLKSQPRRKRRRQSLNR